MNRFLIASKAKSAFTVYFFMSSDKGMYASIYAEVIIFKNENIRLLDTLIETETIKQSLDLENLKLKRGNSPKSNCIQRDELYNLILASEC